MWNLNAFVQPRQRNSAFEISIEQLFQLSSLGRSKSNVAVFPGSDLPFQFIPAHNARWIEPWQMHERRIYKNLYDLTPWSRRPDLSWRCFKRNSPEEWEKMFAVLGVPMPEEYKKPVHLQAQVEKHDTDGE